MTIKDLSALTGYSVGTISRVLNNQPNVSEKARAAILEAAAASGFQLNANAKQLKQLHSTSILVVVKGTGNELFGTLLGAIQARLLSTPYSLIVDNIDEDTNEVSRAIRLCPEKKPLGILFLGGNRQNFQAEFRKIGLPCLLVTADASGLDLSNLSSISSDDRQAGRLAIEYLAALGHQHIAVIGGDRAVSDISRLRYEGCLAAIHAHGLPFDETLDYECVRFSYADGYRGAQSLLSRGRPFTAIFAMSDVMAIGAVRALRDRELRVPEQVSVMGFDGLALGNYTVPTLTTLRQNVAALAERSVRILLDQIENQAPACHEIIPVTLESRESTGRI